MIQAFVALALCLQPSFGSSFAADVSPTGGSYLFTACRESARDVTPLAARPVVARRTLASPLPHRPRRAAAHRPRRAVHHVRPKHKVVRKAAVHRPHAVRHKRTVAHRPIAHRGRPVYRKVTYASPLCMDRAPVINALLDDLALPQFQPIAIPANPIANAPFQTAEAFPATPVPALGGAPGVPNVPLVSGGGGGGGGGGNTEVPPVIAVPEPATWVLLLIGFGGVGFGLRRRRYRRERQAG